MAEVMKYSEAAEYAPQWGSMMTPGDAGACMYGFDETGRPQSEEHRADCIRWMESNLEDVKANPGNYEEGEAEKVESFLAWLREAPTLERNVDLSGLKNDFRLHNDGDIYGTCMAFWFAVCGEMQARGLDVPADWGFRGSRDLESYEAEIMINATDEALQQFGDIMARVYSICKARGLDY